MKLIKRLRLYRPVMMRLAGFFWFVIAFDVLMMEFSTPANPLINRLFNNEPSFIFAFAILCLVRGLLGLFKPVLYWQTFRADLLRIEHNEKRVVFLTLCTFTWGILSFIFNAALPNWIMLWGIGAWCFVKLPDKSAAYSRTAINPATGLPMLPNMHIDTQGNTFGFRNSDLFETSATRSNRLGQQYFDDLRRRNDETFRREHRL